MRSEPLIPNCVPVKPEKRKKKKKKTGKENSSDFTSDLRASYLENPCFGLAFYPIVRKEAVCSIKFLVRNV